MRRAVVFLLTLVVGCGDVGTPGTGGSSGSGGAGGNNGSLTLVFAPVAPTANNLTLQQARVKVEAVAVFGDVAPDSRTMITGETSIDMLGQPVSYGFPMAPQGLYSRVRFRLDEITFQGNYGNYQVEAQIEPEATIDLRDPVGQEVGPGHSAIFTVTIDGTQWFGNLLSQAVPSGDHITIDSLTNNVAVGQQIAHNAAAAISLSSTQGPN
jgi:hypothetical protein